MQNKHGGKREGSGRKKEPWDSKVIRVPLPCVDTVKRIIAAFKVEVKS